MEAEKETSKNETFTVSENVVSNVQKEVITDISEEILFVDDKEFEKKLLRKMDFRIVPLLALLYFLSFLDRVSIGNAKLAHLERDLGLVGSQFNWSLSIFFVGYIIFEVPSNLALIKAGTSKWIPTTMIIWGIVMILMAFVRNFAELMTARFFLGIFEAGLYPGVIYYVTMWYKRSEHSFRMALFTVGGSFAGSFAGLLAYGILTRLEGKANLKGWQWLFLVEGLSTIVIAFSAYFLITDSPEKAKWLSEQERKFAIARLKSDFEVERVEHFNKRQLYAALTDWKVYISMLLLGALMIPGYSFALFLPTIVNGLGFDFIKSQLLSVPPFFVSSLSTLVIALFSDRVRVRGPFIIVCSLFPIIGYILLIVPSTGTAGKYVGTCIVGMGIISCVPTTIAWLASNIPNNAKRGIALAMMLSCGNIGGIVASQIYRQKDYPNYIFGHSIAMGCTVIATCAAITKYFLLKSINKKKKENPQSFLKGKSEEEIRNMGDLHPNFIYKL